MTGGFVLQDGATRRPIHLTVVDIEHGTAFCSTVGGSLEHSIKIDEDTLTKLAKQGTLLIEVGDGDVRRARVTAEAGSLVFDIGAQPSVIQSDSSEYPCLWHLPV